MKAHKQPHLIRRGKTINFVNNAIKKFYFLSYSKFFPLFSFLVRCSTVFGKCLWMAAKRNAVKLFVIHKALNYAVTMIMIIYCIPLHRTPLHSLVYNYSMAQGRRVVHEKEPGGRERSDAGLGSEVIAKCTWEQTQAQECQMRYNFDWIFFIGKLLQLQRLHFRKMWNNMRKYIWGMPGI